MTKLGEFVKRYEEFRTLDVQILAITVNPLEKARETKAKFKAPFPILSDAQRAAMETHGTRNPYHGPGEEPMNTPTLVLIDNTGTIRWVYQAEDYRARAPVTQVLAEVRRIAEHPRT